MEVNAKRAYSFGGFRLDPALLEHGGTLVPLSPKAVDLLYLLASRAPAIVTKEEIFDAVWPGTFVVESSLARNISVIRKALEERAEGPFIETIPKRGYRFVAALDVENAKPVLEEAPLPEIAVPVARPGRWIWVAAAALAVVGLGGILWVRRTPSPPAPEDANARIGQYLLSRGTPAEVAKALAYFEKAVKEHPASAHAHAGLSKTLAIMPGLAAGGTAELRRAREEARVAQRLDANHPDTLEALGLTQLLSDWDFESAERSVRRSLAADPERVDSYYALRLVLSWSGRGGEALQALEAAQRIDPVSPLLGTEYGRVLYEQGQFERARAALSGVLERDPHFALAHYYLGLTYGFLGRHEEAIQQLSAAELNPALLETDRAWVRLRQGDPRPAQELFARQKRAVERREIDPTSPVLLAVALGDLDAALDALTAGLEPRNGVLLAAHADPRLAALHRDARYWALRRKAGLPAVR